MPEPHMFEAGQRVRVNEEDAPHTHVGKIGVIQRPHPGNDGEPAWELKIDRIPETISFPQKFLTPVVPRPSTLLANDLFLPWDLNPPGRRLRAYTEDRELAGQVMERLLFYDRVVVPTVDFSIVVPLVHWIGIPILRELLESDALSFVRFKGTLGYAGNGRGLVLFELHPGEHPGENLDKEQWWQRVATCSPEEAVILQLRNRLAGLPDQAVEIFGKFVEICTVDTALPQFTQKVEEETYRDILGSDTLAASFSIGNTNLKTLENLAPDEVRVFSSLAEPAVGGSEINISLRLAMLNLEAYLSEEAGARDMATDHGFGRLLDAKVERFTGGETAQKAFSHLTTIEKLPDIARSISSGEIHLSAAWEFRNTRVAVQFREWFDKFGPSNPLELEQEYISSLRASGFASSGRTKALRMIVVTGVGLLAAPLTFGLSAFASLGLNAADNYLIDKIKKGFNPRYFIDTLRHSLFKE